MRLDDSIVQRGTAAQRPALRWGVLPEDARCATCDYLLRGLTEPRCPECGEPFDPGDPRSYRTPLNVLPRLRRAFVDAISKPPSISYVTIVAIFALLMAAWTSTLAGYLWSRRIHGTICCLFEVPVFVGVATLVSLDFGRHVAVLGFSVLAPEIAVPAAKTRAIGRRAALGLAATLMWMSWFYAPWYTIAKFAMNEPVLRKAAEDYLALRRSELTFERIGEFHVEFIRGRGFGHAFIQIGHDYGSQFGFIYLPPGAPEPPWRFVWLSPRWRLVHNY